MNWREEISKNLGAMDRTEQELMYKMMLALAEMIQGTIPYDAEHIFQGVWEEVKERHGS